MNKNTFKDYICKPYCVFFKDGEKEEMACHGAAIAQRLVKNQKIFPQHFDKKPLEKDTCFNDDEDLLRLVCTNCPFEAQDCDFRSSSQPKGSVPCGGFIFLFLLKSKNLLTVKDLEEACIEES
ncbi:MAG: hypothetical protein JRJ39_09385 [Deltaproteobacteria bacterium]|nr:hypothetical protein [Deltaproteobacteria bacterium]MBW1847668.1 hypothetical protein [Deltaproteobacteria bacterium]MBW1985144.1 hypothetical protein [Deltaproteobacteria bacterium]MBW2365422.1 hypothetical protein [Deltaproteobacteria bacterium]